MSVPDMVARLDSIGARAVTSYDLIGEFLPLMEQFGLVTQIGRDGYELTEDGLSSTKRWYGELLFNAATESPEIGELAYLGAFRPPVIRDVLNRRLETLREKVGSRMLRYPPIQGWEFECRDKVTAATVEFLERLSRAPQGSSWGW